MSDTDHSHGPADENALRAEALESLLVEKGLVEPTAIDGLIRFYEQEVGPMNGARVVARAWLDRDFRGRLLEDANGAVAEFGFPGPSAEHLVVVENEPGVHNVVVCTLCSCYPWAMLGLPPAWYKSPPYRSRVVREPRALLREMGLDLPDEVEIRVWDSSSEVRYMVLPEPPPGIDGLSEEEIAPLVTRDAMIGVARTRAPEPSRG